MAGRVDDELKLVLTMDADGYIRKAERVRKSTKDITEEFDKMDKAAKKARSIGYDIGSGIRIGAEWAEKAAKAFLAFDTALLGAGLMAAKKAADFESLTLGLAAVDGGAKNAEKSLKRLKEIAKGPGLGVEEAVGTYAGLRRGGLDQELAMSLTRELGNAVARSGGGKEMLGRAGLALGQMATKPFLQGEELNQLTEAGIPAHKIVKDIFGTADTEELKKRGIGSVQVLAALNTELKKLERVAGGSKNSFDNFTDAFEQAVVQVGTGINTVLTPALDAMAKEITDKSESGELKRFGETFATAWSGIFDTFVGGTNRASSAVDLMMTAALAASYASRNAAENVTGAKEYIENFIDDNLFPNTPSKKRSSSSDVMSPWEEAQKGLDAAKTMASNDRRKKRTGRLVLRGGKYVREVKLPNGQWVLEGSKEDTGDTLESPDATSSGPHPKNGSETVRLLKEITANTKPLRDIRDVMLGGGTFSRNAFNPVNMGAWTGSQGQNQIHKGFQMIMSGLASSVNGQFVDLARQRHLDPGAL